MAQTSYFDETYKRLSHNIEIGRFQENLSTYNGWSHHTPFQQLTCHQQGRLLHKIGVTYYSLDQEEKAIDVFNQALERWKNCPGVSRSDKANSIYNIGISYQYLNQRYPAGIYLDSAMVMFESDPAYPRDQLAMKYFGVANFYNDGYDVYKAESYYTVALQFVENVRAFSQLEFEIRNAILTIKLNYHDYAGAMVVWQKAMEVYRRDPSSVDRNTLIHLYLNGGNSAFKLHQYETALDHVNTAMSLMPKARDPYSYSIALEIRSMVLAARGQTEEASRLLDQIIALRQNNITSNEDYTALSTAYTNKAEQVGKLGRFAEALMYVAKAYHFLQFNPMVVEGDLPQAERDLIRDDMQFVHAMDVHAQLLEEKYDRQQRLPDLERALQLSFKIDTLLHQKMLSIQHEKSKVDFIHVVVSFYEKCIERALRMYEETGRPQYLHDAYYFCAKPKSIVLLSEINELEALTQHLTEEQEMTKRSLVERLLSLQKSLSEDDTQQKQHLVTYMQVLREWRKFQTSVERAHPAYYQKKNALIDPLHPDLIRQQLDRDKAHLEYFYGDSALYIFCITRDDLVYERIPLQSKLEAALQSFISTCRNPDQPVDHQNAFDLYRQLIAACLEKVSTPINRIQIVPDGILFKLAFEALPLDPDNHRILMLDVYDISYGYAAVLMLSRPDQKYAIPYAGFFTNYSDQLNQKLFEKGRLQAHERLASLSMSAREINFGAKCFKGEQYEYRDATKARFISSASSSRILHLSLHGLEDTQDPRNSSILFDDSTNDFVLTASDLYNQFLNPDLVVLSACHSGSGKIYGGEGVEGITKAFVLSGANTVISSLWQAVEGSTFRIVSSFFKNIKKGEHLDTAMAGAKRAYLREAEPHMRHPYYWAHFIVLGDTTTHQGPHVPYVLLLFTGIGLAILIWRKTRQTRTSATKP